MNCGRVSNQLSAYLDRELTGAEMLHIRSHLGECDSCRAEHESLSRMKMLLGRLPTPAPSHDFLMATLRRFEESGFGVSAGHRLGRRAVFASARSERIPSLLRRVRRSLPPGAWLPGLPGRSSHRLASPFPSNRGGWAPGLSPGRHAAVRERLGSIVWPRYTIGITTVALAVALILTTVVWRKPRYSDALVATTPLHAIQGRDPVSDQSLSFQLVSEGEASDFFNTNLYRGRQTGVQTSLPWAAVLFQGDGLRSLR